MPNNITQIPAPRVSVTDFDTGIMSREWFRYFNNINTLLGGGLGIVPVSSGGTGLSTTPTNGQLLIGNGAKYTLNTLAVGNGILVTNGIGTITLDNTGVLSNIAGAGISVSNATGNVNIANTGVLSFSGGTTGLTPATTTTGAVSLAGTLGIANGGTNGSASPTAGAVTYGTGTAYAFTAAGTSGQVLISAGASVPTWTSTADININGTVGATTPAAGTFTSLSDSGNLTFTSTANRITGDMSNATAASRVLIQTSTVNGQTATGIMPNGTGTQAQWAVYNSSDPANSSQGRILITSTLLSFQNLASGTGTSLPMAFFTGGSERVRIEAGGNVGIGTTAPNASAILDVQSTTKGVRFPNMTTVQKNAIGTPAAGLVIFDTTLAKLCVYSGAAWQTITSI